MSYAKIVEGENHNHRMWMNAILKLKIHTNKNFLILLLINRGYIGVDDTNFSDLY